MKILSVTELAIPAVKVIRFGKFSDRRGYFTESYRKSDLGGDAGLPELKDAAVLQSNESYSRAGVIRGLHFQWNPFMGKLVRTLNGHMLDIVLDIRGASPTKGKALLYDMPARDGEEWDEWIWVPPGFAHGNLFLDDTRIEYLCTGEYSPGCESAICPFADDIDWSIAESSLKERLDSHREKAIISGKDAAAFTVAQWFADSRSSVFAKLQKREDRP
jgi:dTDP-4-dehydrorhamnose 3,5-epimerase